MNFPIFSSAKNRLLNGNWQPSKKDRGFTLVEMLAYIAILVILVTVIIIFAFWTIRAGSKIKTNYELADNARRALDTMIYEIKKSKSVYTPTSIFDVNPGQLGLEQVASSTTETLTFVDFFKCGNSLCLKREGASPVALTNNRVKITSLTFSQLLNSTATPSVQISLRVESSATSTNPEYAGVLELTSTATLRTY